MSRAAKVARLMGDALQDPNPAELVGTESNNLVQLETDAALPAVSGKNLIEITADASLDWGNRSPLDTYTDTQDPNLPFGWSYIKQGGATPNMPETCINGWIERVALGSDYPDSSGGAGSYFLDTFVALVFDGATSDPNTNDTEHRWTRYCLNGVFGDWKRLRAGISEHSLDWGERPNVTDCNDPDIPNGWIFVTNNALNAPIPGEVGWLQQVQTGENNELNIVQTFVMYDNAQPGRTFVRWTPNKSASGFSDWFAVGNRHEIYVTEFGTSYVRICELDGSNDASGASVEFRCTNVGAIDKGPRTTLQCFAYERAGVQEIKVLNLRPEVDPTPHFQLLRVPATLDANKFEIWVRITDLNDRVSLEFGGSRAPINRKVVPDCVTTQTNQPLGAIAITPVGLEAATLSASNSVVLTDISNVNATNPTDGQVLTYDGVNGQWIAKNAPGFI